MRSRALRRSCNIQSRKAEPGNGVVKAFLDGFTKSLLCVFPGLFRAVFPGYVNKLRWLPVVAVRGSSATQTPEGSSRQVRQRRVPEMMTGTGWPPGLLLSPVRVPADGTGIFLCRSILQQEIRDRHG